jgi:DNA polymerase I-like protein with 3'-5' exonuclease and polymerase domains
VGLKQLKERQVTAPAGRKKATPPAPGAPITTKRTPKTYGGGKTTMPKLSEEAKELIQKAETTSQVQTIIDSELPKGYTAIGKNDADKMARLMWEIIDKGIVSFDYETTGDTEDDTQDPQDHEIVGVSFAHTIGQAFYIPIMHDAYGANWEVQSFVRQFLKPILEHPDVIVIAHNVQFEHSISMLYGIDMLPKTKTRKIIDTMIMLKMLSPEELIYFDGKDYDLLLGLKPATKALLADDNGVIHGLLTVEEVKSFKEMVTLQVQTGTYKTGKNKGLPKYDKKMITFNQRPLDQETIDYGCSDSDWALGLYYKLMPLMEAEDLLDTFFELNMPFVMVLGEYELTGWHANRDRLLDMKNVAYKALYGRTDVTPEEEASGNIEYEEGSIMDKLTEALYEIAEDYIDDNDDLIVPAGSYPMGTWKKETVYLKIGSSKPFNWGSNQHKPWLFFHVLNVDTRDLERSKSTGIPGTGKANWDKIVDGYAGDSAFMKILKEKNKFDKILSTYVNGMLPFLRKDTDKLHTSLRLVSTWRLSSSKPNLQNIPRADNDPMGIRSVFEAPDYDPKADYSHLNICTRPTILLSREALRGTMVYVNADYSQIELRVLAWYANERNMIQAFWDGHDFHSATAHDIFNLQCTIPEVKKLHKPQRYMAKSINFGLVYGLTEYGLAKDPKMGMSTGQAKQFIDKYFVKYPGVKAYANDQIAYAREKGYVETLFGNRRAIPEINHPNEWVRKKGENKAMNTPIQGSASDLIRQAMVNIQMETRKPENSFLKAVMQIHDEIQGESPIEYALEGAMLLKNTMEKPVEGISDVIPIQADPAIGKIWAHALDISFDKETGKAYVSPKKVKNEATDVTIDEIDYMLELYHIAGIEVRC